MLITGIIYVNTDVENSFNRIKIRNRKGEENISKEYLQKLDNYHKEWLLCDKLNTPLLKIEGDKHYENKLPEEWMVRINSFIKTHTANLNIDFNFNVDDQFEKYILF